jgi:hypothetical protein
MYAPLPTTEGSDTGEMADTTGAKAEAAAPTRKSNREIIVDDDLLMIVVIDRK